MTLGGNGAWICGEMINMNQTCIWLVLCSMLDWLNIGFHSKLKSRIFQICGIHFNNSPHAMLCMMSPKLPLNVPMTYFIFELLSINSDFFADPLSGGKDFISLPNTHSSKFLMKFLHEQNEKEDRWLRMTFRSQKYAQKPRIRETEKVTVMQEMSHFSFQRLHYLRWMGMKNGKQEIQSFN